MFAENFACINDSNRRKDADMKIEMEEYYNIVGIIDGLYHEAALKQHMTDSEQMMFYVIAAYGNGCNQSLLYKETGLKKSTVNTSIRKLEKENVLYLEAGEGKNTRVFLTEKGMEYLARIEKLIEAENAVFTSWPKKEQELFIGLNRRFAEQMEEKIQEL